jgi:hypothetical protein
MCIHVYTYAVVAETTLRRACNMHVMHPFYVSMHAYMYIFMHVSKHIYIYIYIHTYIHTARRLRVAESRTAYAWM